MSKLEKTQKSFENVKSDVVKIESIGVYLMFDKENKKPVVRVDIFKPTARSKKLRFISNNFKSIKKALKIEKPNYLPDAEMMPDNLFAVPISSFKVEKVETTTKENKAEKTPKKEVKLTEKEIAKKNHKKVDVKTVKTKKHGKVRIVDYSPASFAFFGKETKQMSKDKKFKKYNGFGYCPNLTDVDGEKKPGWVVSKKAEKEMYKLLK